MCVFLALEENFTLSYLSDFHGLILRTVHYVHMES